MSEEIQFKKEISTIGKVLDFDFPNAITNCKPCFTDPIHTTYSINTIMKFRLILFSRQYTPTSSRRFSVVFGCLYLE